MAKKIVIIEDEKVLLDILVKKLKSEGFKVVAAPDGVAGLALVKKEKPDLVITDILMPKMDGYQVLEEMKKNEKISSIPVIVISNSGQPIEIDRAVSLGADDYLIKAQFNPDEVIAKVKKLFNKGDSGAAKKSKDDITILIVEDDKFLKDLAAKKLEKEGFVIVEASDGEEALKLAKQTKPNLILLDIILPGIDGFDVLQRLRADNAFRNTSIILLSNLGQKDDIQKGLDLGATDYLIKAHYTLDEIITKIKEHI